MAPNPKLSAFALVTVALVTSLPAASLGSGPPSSAFSSNVNLSAVDPIAALEHLVQAGGGGIVAGRGCLIAVHERHSHELGRGIDDLPIQLGGQRQMLVGIAAHAHRNLERMHAVVIGDAGLSIGFGGHDLTHLVCERLADIGLRERDAVHLRHIARNAIGTRSVGEAAVGIRQAGFGIFRRHGIGLSRHGR